MNEIATFAMGCFWSPQLLFSQTPGVTKTTVGYCGGDEKKYPSPTYEQVCSDKSGFAESVQIEFDPKKITYKKLLDLFWKHHDPTQYNQQGPDVGSQYRSAIFVHSKKQEEAALQSKLAQKGKYSKPIQTIIEPIKKFYPAEDYHQDYLKKRGQTTCHI